MAVSIVGMSLTLATFSITPPPPLPTPECSLNGEHTTGKCTCDPGWLGEACSQLDLLPAPALDRQVTRSAATTTSNAVANATWGISVVGPDKSGLLHGYMTEIANGCKLGDYGTASQIVHMTAPAPLGLWTRRGIALAGFAHNPQAVMAPNGSILLFHIGEQLPPGCVKDCRNSSTDRDSGSGTPNVSCPSLGHGTSVAVADSFEGPWTRYPYILGPGPTNPAPYILSNGSIYLGTRRKSSAAYPAWMGHASTPGGPWRPVATRVVSTAQGTVSVSEEDSFIWSNKRGYHMLTHRAVKAADGWPPRPSTGCGGGHLFSPDLITWFVGGNAFGRSANDSAQCDLTLASSKISPPSASRGSTERVGGGGGAPTGARTSAIRLTSRQRPTVLETSDGKRFLYTGASGPEPNITEYQHSYTLVQEINTAG